MLKKQRIMGQTTRVGECNLSLGNWLALDHKQGGIKALQETLSPSYTVREVIKILVANHGT